MFHAKKFIQLHENYSTSWHGNFKMEQLHKKLFIKLWCIIRTMNQKARWTLLIKKTCRRIWNNIWYPAVSSSADRFYFTDENIRQRPKLWVIKQNGTTFRAPKHKFRYFMAGFLAILYAISWKQKFSLHMDMLDAFLAFKNNWKRVIRLIGQEKDIETILRG